MNPALNSFFIKARTAAATIDKWHVKGSDHGALHYFQIIKLEPTLPAYLDRAGQVAYIIKDSPKLKILAHMAYQIYNVY